MDSREKQQKCNMFIRIMHDSFNLGWYIRLQRSYGDYWHHYDHPVTEDELEALGFFEKELKPDFMGLITEVIGKDASLEERYHKPL